MQGSGQRPDLVWGMDSPQYGGWKRGNPETSVSGTVGHQSPRERGKEGGAGAALMEGGSTGEARTDTPPHLCSTDPLGS